MLQITPTNPWSDMAYFKMSHGHKCLILGHQERLANNPLASLRAAIELGASPERICLIHAPNGPTEPGFQLIKVPSYLEPVEAEGVMLTEVGSAAIIQTADCPTIILTDTLTGKKVVTHAGRSALTPQEHCTSCTIVETALAQLGARDSKHVQAFILGDICGSCFLHDDESASAIVEPFLKLGDDVFDDIEKKGLSLFGVIQKKLRYAGVPLMNIEHYGECTFEHHRYASHRRDGDRNDRNHIIVVKVR